MSILDSSIAWLRAFGLTRIEYLASVGLLGLAVIVAPYANINWPNSGPIGAATLLVGGIVLLAGLWTLTGRVQARVLIGSHAMRLPWSLLLGGCIQLVVAAAAAPVPVFDDATYLSIATSLVATGEYLDDAGRLAFYPPGYPLCLAPFIAIFDAPFPAVVACNLVLYAIAATSVWKTAERLFGPQTAFVAFWLFTVWPSRILVGSLPVRENLTVSAIMAGFALTLIGLSGRRAQLSRSVPAGLCFGLATLAQPGFQLFTLALPIAFRQYARFVGGRRFALFFATTILTASLTTMPWQVRNYVVFDGAFRGISTNGGSVFYRANNPMATGIHAVRGEIDLAQFSELEQNALGYELGRQWILENPVSFAKLAGKKLLHLLSDDNYGAYFAIYRGDGRSADHPASATDVAAVARTRAYEIVALVSLLFWLVLAVSAARQIVAALPAPRSLGASLTPLLYPLLYSAIVYSIFESGTRQRMVATAFLIIVAAREFVAEHTNQKVASPGYPLAAQP